MVAVDVGRLSVLERVMIVVNLAYLEVFFPGIRLAERSSAGAVGTVETGSSGSTGCSVSNGEVSAKCSVGVDRALGDMVEGVFRAL